jgi:hypothetical protein
MSFITNTAYIVNKINSLKLKITSEESAEGSVGVPAESFASAVQN